MSKILGGVSIAVSALIILAFLGIYNITSLIGFDIIMIGALLLVATQIFYYFQVHVGGGGRLSSLLVKFVSTSRIALYFQNFCSVHWGISGHCNCDNPFYGENIYNALVFRSILQ